MESHPRDGASIRRDRLLAMLQWIDAHQDTEPRASAEGLATWMVLQHGLRRDTTDRYLRELQAADTIVITKTNMLLMKRPFPKMLGSIETESH